MRTIQQQSTASRAKYLRTAANWARKEYQRLLNHPDYRHCHESFALRDALQNTEAKYTDLGTFGVEYIQKGSNRLSPAITYLNTGDTYELTILYVNGQFRVGCWGNYVERGNYA